MQQLNNIKTLLSIFLFLIIIDKVSSQSQIIGLKDWSINSPQTNPDQPDLYFKDLNNDFAQFEGEYAFQNSTTYFKIKLVKKEAVFLWDNHSDLLIGEIKYVTNNVVKVNTLNKINAILDDPYDHKIVLFMISEQNSYRNCANCLPNQTRLFGRLNDGKLDYDIILRKILINGTEAILLEKYGSWVMPTNEGDTPTDLSYNIPSEEYIMLKQ